MNIETLFILLFALAGFVGIAIIYLVVSRKSAVSPKPAKPVQEKSFAELVAEGLVGAKPLPVPVSTPGFALAFRKNGRRDKFRVVGTNRHRVFLGELGRTGGCVMSRPRSRVQFV